MQICPQFISVLLCCTTIATAEFQNLSFDEGDPTGLEMGDQAPASKLLPGWALTSGAFSLAPIYDLLPPDPAMGAGDAHVMSSTNVQGFPVFGKLGLVLVPALVVIPPSSLGSVEIKLTQQGHIPTGTKSLHFIASSTFFSDPPSFIDVRVNGTPLRLFWQPIPEQTRRRGEVAYAVWSVSADVVVFAGREVELSVETRLQTFPSGGVYPSSLVYYGIDEVSFSPLEVNASGPPKFHDLQTSGKRNLVVSWTGAAWLEAASSLQGPWRVLPSASSPYTNSFAYFISEFYRLKYFDPIEPPQ